MHLGNSARIVLLQTGQPYTQPLSSACFLGINRCRLLEMAVFMTWSLSSAIRRRREPAYNISGQIPGGIEIRSCIEGQDSVRLILALPWRNNRSFSSVQNPLAANINHIS